MCRTTTLLLLLHPSPSTAKSTHVCQGRIRCYPRCFHPPPHIQLTGPPVGLPANHPLTHNMLSRFERLMLLLFERLLLLLLKCIPSCSLCTCTHASIKLICSCCCCNVHGLLQHC
jgi:hypothetical protein